MRSHFFLVLLPLAACAAGPQIVVTKSDTIVNVQSVADELATADVVALGELHQTPPVHRTHHELLAALHRARPNMVIAMEMFERDTQPVLLQYLSGFVDEATFRKQARPWPNYDRDYRPVIEFAKDNGLVVLAANAPRPLAKQAAKEGVAAVLGNPHVARETSAPMDEYWDAFCEAMEGHEGMLGPDGMQRYYGAQCLKDDTMAETITDYVAERNQAGDRPLVVLICGRMHSDHGRGTVARIRQRMPSLTVRVLSAEIVGGTGPQVYESERDVAEFIVLAPAEAVERAEPRVAAKTATAVKSGEPSHASGDGDGDGNGDDEPMANPEGLRPALGFMPDYSAADDGVLVGDVREGGPAARAGIVSGDFIIALDGVPTPDIETYAEVLDMQVIGRKATVRVRRNTGEVDLEVVVGSRSR